MRSLYISLTLFIILIICIVINVGFIHHCADYLADAASELSVSDEEELAALEAFWETRKEYIGLSISETHLDNVGKIIVSLRCAHEENDSAEFKKNIALLKNAAEELRRYERLSVENIF